MSTPQTTTSIPSPVWIALCAALVVLGVAGIVLLGMPGLIAGTALICAAIVLFVRARR